MASLDGCLCCMNDAMLPFPPACPLPPYLHPGTRTLLAPQTSPSKHVVPQVAPHTVSFVMPSLNCLPVGASPHCLSAQEQRNDEADRQGVTR